MLISQMHKQICLPFYNMDNSVAIMSIVTSDELHYRTIAQNRAFGKKTVANSEFLRPKLRVLGFKPGVKSLIVTKKWPTYLQSGQPQRCLHVSAHDLNKNNNLIYVNARIVKAGLAEVHSS